VSDTPAKSGLPSPLKSATTTGSNGVPCTPIGMLTGVLKPADALAITLSATAAEVLGAFDGSPE
jgi:hypothetical protein